MVTQSGSHSCSMTPQFPETDISHTCNRSPVCDTCQCAGVDVDLAAAGFQILSNLPERLCSSFFVLTKFWESLVKFQIFRASVGVKKHSRCFLSALGEAWENASPQRSGRTSSTVYDELVHEFRAVMLMWHEGNVRTQGVREQTDRRVIHVVTRMFLSGWKIKQLKASLPAGKTLVWQVKIDLTGFHWRRFLGALGCCCSAGKHRAVCKSEPEVLF